MPDNEATPLLTGNGPPRVTPLPKRQITILCLLRISEPIAFVVCFPFINQMLLDLGVVHDATKTGFYAGLIEAMFSVAQLLTVYQWGSLSDRIGRKPVLIFGCVGSAISAALFGLSKSFTAMVITRSLAGFANGNVGVIKSALAEITDKTNASRAFALFPLCYAVGTIIASLIGGSLTNVGDKWPGAAVRFPILVNYPFFLPCLVAGLFPLACALLALVSLDETLPTRGAATDDCRTVQPSLRAVLQPTVTAVLINFGILTLQNTALVGLLPLYCFTRVVDGGLGFNEAQIAKVLAIRAVATIGVQLLTFPPLQRRFGTLSLYRVFMCLFVPSFCALPLLNILARYTAPAAVWTGITMTLLCAAIANMAFSCNMLMVMEITPSRDLLGTVNVGSAMRAVGPGSASAMFAFSVDRQALGGNLIWVAFGLMAIVGAISGLMLPEISDEKDSEDSK